MASSNEQWEFLKDIAKLIVWADENGYKMTAGEGYRTQDQQNLYYYGLETRVNNGDVFLVNTKPKSKVPVSRHQDRMAHDFNISVNGELTYDADRLRPIGEYWKSLHPKNVWGGDWGWDAGHFERGA
ncbi:hypothetical protein [Hydrogenimonas sp.]